MKKICYVIILSMLLNLLVGCGETDDKTDLLSGHKFGETENETNSLGRTAYTISDYTITEVKYIYGDNGLREVDYIFKNQFPEISNVFGDPVPEEYGTFMNDLIDIIKPDRYHIAKLASVYYKGSISYRFNTSGHGCPTLSITNDKY